MSIEKQKAVADKILDSLFLIDPHCILAGGAPRDWYMGKEANDLDFYIYSENPTGVITKQLKAAGFDNLVQLDGGNFPEEYSTMKSLRKVYETEKEGQKVQIMVMNEKTFSSVVPAFGATISMFWYKGGRVQADSRAKASIKYKVIGYRDDFSCKETYFKKIKDRFKGYQFVKMSDFDKVILNKVYTEIHWSD